MDSQIQQPTSQPPATPTQVNPSDLPPVSGNQKPSKKRFKLKQVSTRLLITTIIIIAVILGLFTASGMMWYRSQLQPLANDDSYHVISIIEGSSSADIAKLLQDEQIIRSATAFRWYLRLNTNPTLQAGDYRLSSQQSVADIVKSISQGDVATLDVLIPPGKRLDEIKNLLVKAGYEEADIDDALSRVQDHPLVATLPNNALLEGYLFPDTYRIGPKTDAETLVRLMLTTFQDQITPDITKGLAQQNIALKDAIILASIIQQEVPDPETQRIVAQVFIRRLKEGVPLGADPTFKYAAIMSGRTATPDLDSPYNTRVYAGLPPTAISNFNISALRAVASPSRTNYKYFVAGDDGKTHFTRTLSEHEAATRKYCTTLCQ